MLARGCGMARGRAWAGLRSFTSAATRQDLAKITLVGRIASEPEHKTSRNGNEYMTYVIATNALPSPGEERGASTFHNIASFDERFNQSAPTRLSKGSLVYFEGILSVVQRRDESSGQSTQLINIRHGTLQVLQRKDAAAAAGATAGGMAGAES